VLPFTDRHVALARSIAGQAAVALENHRLYRDIQNLFHGFVEAAVTAIEARDPTTGGHSHRVAELTTLLAREVNERGREDALVPQEHGIAPMAPLATVVHRRGRQLAQLAGSCGRSVLAALLTLVA